MVKENNCNNGDDKLFQKKSVSHCWWKMNHRHRIALKIDHRWGLSLFVQNLRRQCLLTNSSCILWIATVPSVFPSLSSNSTWKRQKGMRHTNNFSRKNLLEEKLRKNILEEKSLAKTCWRKPALTLSLASSSTSSNSSSLERGHSILSSNNKNPSITGCFF